MSVDLSDVGVAAVSFGAKCWRHSNVGDGVEGSIEVGCHNLPGWKAKRRKAKETLSLIIL